MGRIPLLNHFFFAKRDKSINFIKYIRKDLWGDTKSLYVYSGDQGTKEIVIRMAEIIKHASKSITFTAQIGPPPP